MERKKKIIVTILLLALLLCFIPIKQTYKDGGTVKYQAVLWSYTRYHQLIGDGDTFYEGKEFRVFPFNFAPPSSHTVK